MTQPIIPIKSTTQAFTEMETIDKDIVLFTDGSCALVVTATAVNFGLLSEKNRTLSSMHTQVFSTPVVSHRTPYQNPTQRCDCLPSTPRRPGAETKIQNLPKAS